MNEPEGYAHFTCEFCQHEWDETMTLDEMINMKTTECPCCHLIFDLSHHYADVEEHRKPQKPQLKVINGGKK